MIFNIKAVASIAAILAVFGATWYVRGMKADIDQQAALQAQKIEIVAQCEADKRITSEASREYQKKISTLNNRVRELKRVLPARCVPVTSAARGLDGSASAGVTTGTQGISAEWALDLGAEAEKYRQQLISLQEFVRKAGER